MWRVWKESTPHMAAFLSTPPQMVVLEQGYNLVLLSSIPKARNHQHIDCIDVK